VADGTTTDADVRTRGRGGRSGHRRLRVTRLSYLPASVHTRGRSAEVEGGGRNVSYRSPVRARRALAGRLLLCQVGLRRRSRAALAGRAGLPGWGCFIPSTSRWATTPWPGRKLGDDGGGLVTGLQPGHGAVGRC
jgi:hypothetical protein